MCRIFAYWGNEERVLSDFLIYAPNSLIQQSICDATNRPNADGWGIAFFQVNGEPILIKRPYPAYEDESFRESALRIRSRLVFAHVRRGSHGPICYENTHPFIKNSWVFMHNGNIPQFEKFKAHFLDSCYLEEEIKPRGDTDSEFLFHCILERIKKYNANSVDAVTNVLKLLIQKTNSWVSKSRIPNLALNFLLTNGQYIISYRQNRTLYYALLKEGIVFSSEKISEEHDWIEIPEKHFAVALTPHHIKTFSIQELEKIYS